MTLTHDESSAELSRIACADAETLWTVISRPQIMRFWPPIRTQAALGEWLSDPSVSVWLNHSLESGYGMGMVSLVQAKIDGPEERVLSYAFDRCVEGRNWALVSIRAVAATKGLDGAICLIGPAMANSERVAKAVGFVFERAIELDGVPYRLFRFGS
jgi:hypothetical protein